MRDEGRAVRDEDDAEREPRPEGQAARSGEEWTTLGISAVVVLLLVGAALVEVFLRDDPAGTWISVEVLAEEAEERGGRTYVPFTVRNDGAEAGKDVTVTFEVSAGETVVEETTVAIALLASHGTHRGELVTTRDLGTHTLTARVGAVQAP